MAYREVAEPKKPEESPSPSSDLDRQKLILAVYIFTIVGIMILLANVFYRLGVDSAWVEAEKRGFAERVYQTSAGQVYRWRSPTDLEHIHLFWREAVKRGYAERVEWPEGLGEFRWKEAE